MFVVAGVTGNTGSVVARTLRDEGHQVRGITRDPSRVEDLAGAELIAGELHDPVTMRRAFTGADAAYVLCPPDVRSPDPIGLYARVAQVAADAARATGLRRIVLLSSIGAHLPGGTGPVLGLHEAEAILAGAAPETVFLRPTYFMTNLRGMLEVARDRGVLPTFSADVGAKSSMVATQDIGLAAAALLREPSPPHVVELSGPEDYSVNDVAAVFGDLLGRPVTPVQPPREAWVGILEHNGMSQRYAELLAEMYGSLNEGTMGFEGVPDQRRGVTTLREAVAGWL